MILSSDTITAISTPQGKGGIAVIRVSGPEARQIVNKSWEGADLLKVSSHTVHLGNFISSEGQVIDQGVATVFVSPKSFTGEDIVEISVHGSPYIQREILSQLVKNGARIATPGEFTQRAFLNGKMDLAQAEGIADLIASESKAAHDMAINQTRGSFSKEFNFLRERLIELASLLELELDFSEEDVEFAPRDELIALCREILGKVQKFAKSYSQGAVLKNGVPVVIAGVPNAGKSSLLNTLLGEEKAIVTSIPGTTRDLIEDSVEIDGILYRFYDTAGLRETNDVVESLGVERANEMLEKAFIVIWVIDPSQPLEPQFQKLSSFAQNHTGKNIIPLISKSDLRDTWQQNLDSDISISNKEDNQPTEGNFVDSINEENGLSSLDLGTYHSSSKTEENQQYKEENSRSSSYLGISISPSNSEENQQYKEENCQSSSYLGISISSSDSEDNQQYKEENKTLFSPKNHTYKNFSDLFISICNEQEILNSSKVSNPLLYSSKTQEGLHELLQQLHAMSTSGLDTTSDIIVTNARHFEALTLASESLARTLESLQSQIPADLIAQDIRRAISHLSLLTGTISSSTLLHSIFSRFCIGK